MSAVQRYRQSNLRLHEELLLGSAWVDAALDGLGKISRATCARFRRRDRKSVEPDARSRQPSFFGGYGERGGSRSARSPRETPHLAGLRRKWRCVLSRRATLPHCKFSAVGDSADWPWRAAVRPLPDKELTAFSGSPMRAITASNVGNERANRDELRQTATMASCKPGGSSMRSTLVRDSVLYTSGTALAGPLKDGLAAAKRGDYATALQLIRPLAKRGDTAALFSLGGMFDTGKGVSRDPVQLRFGIGRPTTRRLWHNSA